MKKIITLIVLILLMSLTFAACSAPPPPGSSWADTETLEYKVTRDKQDAGTMTATIKRDLTAQEKTINGKEYNRATSRVSMNYTFNDQSLIVESLLDDFSPIATYKKVVTPERNYELTSYYMGKYYHYNLKQGEDEYIGKIKTKGEFIDNELLYTYIRCYNLSNMNKTLNIPTPKTNDLQSVNVRLTGTEKIKVPFPDGEKTVECHKLAIARGSEPIGKSILVYYTPDSKDYIVQGGLLSINESKKIPVKIVENDVTYQLTKITVL